MKQIKFTKEGLADLKKEYEELLGKRPEAVRTLKAARELGDLSENSLYHAAKSNLRSIDSRLQRISNTVRLAKIVDVQKILVERNGEKIEYQIVGDYEADPKNNKISANSPIGSALKDKKAGDEIEIKTPAGILKLKILNFLK